MRGLPSAGEGGGLCDCIADQAAIDCSTSIFALRRNFGELQHSVLGLARSAGKLGIPAYAVRMSGHEPATQSRYLRGSFELTPGHPTRIWPRYSCDSTPGSTTVRSCWRSMTRAPYSPAITTSCSLTCHRHQLQPGDGKTRSQPCTGLGLDDSMPVALAAAYHLPFPSGELDLVVALGLLPWLHDAPRAVAELVRVLRPEVR